MTYFPEIDEFSDSYYIFTDARAVAWPEEHVAVAEDTYAYLDDLLSEPLLKISGGHYWPSAEPSMPPNVVALPDKVAAEHGSAAILVAKPETREQLITCGAV